jgi:hypothetical protein
MSEEEGEWARLDLHFPRNLEHGLESHSLLANFVTVRFFLAVAYVTDTVNVTRGEAILARIDHNTMRINRKFDIGINPSLSSHLKSFVVGILDQFVNESAILSVIAYGNTVDTCIQRRTPSSIILYS